MRAHLLDHLRRRALIETEHGSELPSGFSEAIDGLTAEEIAVYLFREMLDDVQAGYADAGDVLSLEAEFVSVVPKRALEKMANYVLQFARDFAQNEREGIKALVLDSVAKGSGPVELRRAIKGYFAEGVHYVGDDGKTIERTVNLDSWAETVARTELARGYTMGAMALYQDAGVQKVMWADAGDPNECAECEAASGEVVDLGDAFPFVDVDSPPAHPRCYCTIIASPSEIERFNAPEAKADRADKLAHYRSVAQ